MFYISKDEVFSCQDVRNFGPVLEEYLLALIAHNVDIWTEEAMDINYVTHTEWYF